MFVKDPIDEALDLILVVLPGEEALLGRVVHSLLVGALANHGLRGAHACVLVSLEGHVAEHDADVLALEHAIVAEVVPKEGRESSILKQTLPPAEDKHFAPASSLNLTGI